MSVVNYKAKCKAIDLLKFDDPHSFYETQTAEKAAVFFYSFWLSEQCCVVTGWETVVYILCLTNLKDKGR